MKLIIAIDGEILERVRARANRENTSVNMLIQKYLEEYGGSGRHPAEACERLLALSRSSQSRRGNTKWTREELYER